MAKQQSFQDKATKAAQMKGAKCPVCGTIFQPILGSKVEHFEGDKVERIEIDRDVQRWGRNWHRGRREGGVQDYGHARRAFRLALDIRRTDAGGWLETAAVHHAESAKMADLPHRLPMPDPRAGR